MVNLLRVFPVLVTMVIVVGLRKLSADARQNCGHRLRGYDLTSGKIWLSNDLRSRRGNTVALYHECDPFLDFTLSAKCTPRLKLN